MKVHKRKNKQSLRDYQTLAFTLITVAFFGFFAVRPSVSLIVSLFHERSLYTKVNTDLETKIQQIITLQTDYMRLLSKKEMIDQAIPPVPNLQEIETLLNTKIELNTFGVTEIQLKPAPAQGLVVIPISLAGRASYKDIVQYAHTVYAAPRLFYMKSIDLGQSDGSSASAQLRFSAKIN